MEPVFSFFIDICGNRARAERFLWGCPSAPTKMNNSLAKSPKDTPVALHEKWEFFAQISFPCGTDRESEVVPGNTWSEQVAKLKGSSHFVWKNLLDCKTSKYVLDHTHAKFTPTTVPFCESVLYCMFGGRGGVVRSL